MFFNKCDIHENKLSEQLADNNPYKKKLIAMETPKEKHPIYSTLVFSLLAYCWVFLGIMLIKHLYGNLFSVINLIFVSCCVAITYKKDYLTGMHMVSQAQMKLEQEIDEKVKEKYTVGIYI